jgi:hypothetical protein
MVLFWPIQQEIECINGSGVILGRIKFDGPKEVFTFSPDNESVVLTRIEKSSIDERLSGLDSGKYSLPMQDDD